jgi:hypothetical protein
LDEHEWLTGADPDRMLAFLLDGHVRVYVSAQVTWAPHRKLRLLACAFCRRIEDLLVDERSRRAVLISEQFVDGWVTEGELRRAYEAATKAVEDWVNRTSTSAVYGGGVFSLPSADRKATALGARAVAEATAPLRPEIAVSTAFEAAIERGAAMDSTAWAVEALGVPARLRLIRDVFGNPFRPVPFSPQWRSEDVVAIARAIYEDRTFDRLPILADALQDAGCDSDELLEHCRGDGPHVLGCWALDVVLGK